MLRGPDDTRSSDLPHCVLARTLQNHLQFTKRCQRMRRDTVLTVLLVFLLSTGAHAEQKDHRFGVGWSQWGLYDDFDIETVKATYEFGEVEKIWGVRPVVSGFTSGGFDAYYLAGGWLKEFTISQSWSWGIGMVGGYFNGDELGHEVEFYSRCVLNYRATPSFFVRAETGHISNAGLGDRNPGSENLALTFHWVF